MVNKSSKKWYCKHGCDVSLKPCAHIEKTLPQEGDNAITNGKHRLNLTKQDSKVTSDQVFNEKLDRKKEFREYLSQFLLTIEEENILYDRFAENRSSEYLANKYRYTKSGIHYKLELSLNRIKLELSKKINYNT